MSTVKRTLVNVSFYDPEAIQRKLEQMAARGWMIQKAGNLFWTYTKIPPQKLRFSSTQNQDTDPVGLRKIRSFHLCRPTFG